MMKVGFIDTSFLLSLVFEDDNFEEAYGIWNELEIFCGSVLLEIENIERLKHLKSLDSVHLATAHIFAKMIDTSILLCSYDKNMMKAGAELGMSTLHP
jgi:predicted nucleic acid-binding protein